MPQVRDARDILNSHSIETRSQIDEGYVCTIVNMVPIDIDEQRPHMFPSSYFIEAAPSNDDFSITYVGEAVHYVPDPFDEKRSFKQVTPPHEMARSLCEDWKLAHIALGEGAVAGLIWFHGRLDKEEIKRKHGKALKLAREMQINWYKNLIDLADVDWEKSKNRLAVSDLQRIAARSLGVMKDWVDIKVDLNTSSCPMCKAAVQPDAAICFNCKYIVNPELHAKLMKGQPTTKEGELSVKFE